jgi:hypothetical protein
MERPSESAHTWPVRSPPTRPSLMATILSLRAITKGSLTNRSGGARRTGCCRGSRRPSATRARTTRWTLPTWRVSGGVGDHAFLEEGDDPVREHLGVDAVGFRLCSRHCITASGSRRSRSGAVARPRRAPRRARRWPEAIFSHPVRGGELEDGRSASTTWVRTGDVDEGVSERPRHAGVHERDHGAGFLRRRLSCTRRRLRKEQ